MKVRSAKKKDLMADGLARISTEANCPQHMYLRAIIGYLIPFDTLFFLLRGDDVAPARPCSVMIKIHVVVSCECHNGLNTHSEFACSAAVTIMNDGEGEEWKDILRRIRSGPSSLLVSGNEINMSDENWEQFGRGIAKKKSLGYFGLLSWSSQRSYDDIFVSGID